MRLALHPGGVEKLAHIDTNGKEAQRAPWPPAPRLGRVSAGPRRRAESEEIAATFLEGMQSPRRGPSV